MKTKKMKDSDLEALALKIGCESGMLLRNPTTKLTDTLSPYPGQLREKRKRKEGPTS